MVFDFDLRLFCENLKATKPPYECPAPGCGRVYKTYVGIQFHLFNYDHDNPDGKSSSTPGNIGQPKQQDTSRRGHHRQVRSPSRATHDDSVHELTSSSLSPHNVSTKSQRVVEITLGGQVHHIDVFEPMNVVVRQPQVSVSENGDKKLSETVACKTLSADTVLLEPESGTCVIDNSMPVVDSAATCPPLAADAPTSVETESEDCLVEMPVETVASENEKTERNCDDEASSDTKACDVNETTATAGSAVIVSVPTSEHLPSDDCTLNDNISLSRSAAYDSGDIDVATEEMKPENASEEPIQSSAECGDNNFQFSDDRNSKCSSVASGFSFVSATCVELSSECNAVKNSNDISTSTAVVSVSAPSKCSLPTAEFKILSNYTRPPTISATDQKPEYYKFTERTSEELDSVVEYDMDEEVV